MPSLSFLHTEEDAKKEWEASTDANRASADEKWPEVGEYRLTRERGGATFNHHNASYKL